MEVIANILRICYHELRLEFKQKFAIAGILLFLVSSIFIVYKIFQSITPFSWNALYWILFLFVAINALIKSFSKMNKRRFMYYFQLYDALELAISKMIYNSGLLFVIGIILFVLLSAVSINPIERLDIFLSALLLGSIGVGSTVSFNSLIANKGEQTHILISILSLPIMVPTVLMLAKITAVSMGIIGDTSLTNDFVILMGIDLFSIGLCLILFPYLWRI